VPWQNLGDENTEALATAATLAAIAAPHPLTANTAAIGSLRIVAVKLAVAVYSFRAAAVRAPLLLERKRCSSSASRSRTNRVPGNCIRSCCRKTDYPVEPFFDGTPRRRDSVH
jgi:hypothetical protein